MPACRIWPCSPTKHITLTAKALDTEFKKKVRKDGGLPPNRTAQNLNLCRQPLPGTPYFQAASHCAMWLSGTACHKASVDNILKEVANNIQAFTFDDANTVQFPQTMSSRISSRTTATLRLPKRRNKPKARALLSAKNDDLNGNSAQQ